MASEANCQCGRCGKPIYISISRENTLASPSRYCDSCEDYRSKTFERAEKQAKREIISSLPEQTCYACGGKGYLKGGGVKATCAECHGKRFIKDEYNAIHIDLSNIFNVSIPGDPFGSHYSKRMREEMRKLLPRDFDKGR